MGVEGPAGHHRRCCRGPFPGRGRPRLRRLPVLDQPPRGPLAPRRGRRVRGPLSPAPLVTERDTSTGHRPHPRPAQDPDRAGPGRRPAHHLLSPAAGAHRRLHGDDLADPDPPRRRHRRPVHAAEEFLPPVRGGVAQPNVAVRLHPLATRRRQGRGDPELARRPLPLPPGLHRPPARHRPRRPRRIPHCWCSSRPPGLGAHGRRTGLHHPVRRRPPRPNHPQRPRARTRPPRGAAEELQPEPPPDLRESNASTRPSRSGSLASPEPEPWPNCRPSSTSSAPTTEPSPVQCTAGSPGSGCCSGRSGEF